LAPLSPADQAITGTATAAAAIIAAPANIDFLMRLLPSER
jgi:hypothetical protein